MGVRQAGELSDYRLERRQVLATLAIAGIAGPIAFVVVLAAQSLVHPDYSQVKRPISALAAWPGGWVQDANFMLFGLLTILFAIGLHLGVRRNRAAVIGPGLLMLSGVALIIAGFFPWRSVDGDFVVPAGHLLGALLSFVGTGSERPDRALAADSGRPEVARRRPLRARERHSDSRVVRGDFRPRNTA